MSGTADENQIHISYYTSQHGTAPVGSFSKLQALLAIPAAQKTGTEH